MKIKSNAVPALPPAPAPAFPRLMEWAYDNDTPDPKDPYVTGKSKLVVLFTDELAGVALVRTAGGVTLARESFVGCNVANWKPFVGKVTLAIES